MKVSTLTWLLLGLCMEYKASDNDTKNDDDGQDTGGWTRSNIMEMIVNNNKGSISKFISCLEQLKKEENTSSSTFNTVVALFPYSVCSLEYDVWRKWYNDNVLVVRKRVVQELTGGGDENDQDDSDSDIDNDNDGIPSSEETGQGQAATTAEHDANELRNRKMKKKSEKNMSKLISQQSKEIITLQESLSAYKQSIEEKEKLLMEYKRRIESTPTQLDAMLNEYSDKTVSLGNENSQLKEKLTTTEEKYKQDVQKFQEQLDEIQQTNKDTILDNDNLREEMVALSTAYTNLEVQYQKEQEEKEAVKTEKEEIEKKLLQEQQEATVATTASNSMTPPGSSSEVSMLRSENERLKQDTKAADDWMKMAVERMNHMGQENGALQTEIQALKQQLQEQNQGMSSNADNDVLQQQLKEQQMLQQELQQQLQEEQEQEIRVIKEEQEKKNQDFLKTIETMQQQLSQEQNEKEDLQKQLATAAVQHQNQEQESIQVLQQQVLEEQRQKEELKAQLSELTELQQQNIERNENEQKEREQGLQEQQKLKEEEMSKLRSENEKLVQDTKAAAEWMEMAVGRMNQMGQDNVKLQQDIASMKDQNEKLLLSQQQQQQQQQEHKHEMKEQLKQDWQQLLQNQQEQQQGSQQQMQQTQELEQQNKKYQGEVESLTNKIQEITIDRNELQESIQSLQKELEVSRQQYEVKYKQEEEEIYKKEAKIRELQAMIQQQQEQMSSLNRQLQEQQQGLTGQFSSDDDKNLEIQKLREANEAAQDWMSKAVAHHQMLSDQVSSLSDENDNLQVQMKEMKATSIQQQRDSYEKAKKEVETKVHEKDEKIQQLEQELTSVKQEQTLLKELHRKEEVEHMTAAIQQEQYQQIQQQKDVDIHQLQCQLAEKENVIIQLEEEKLSLCDNLQKELDVATEEKTNLFRKLEQVQRQQQLQQQQHKEGPRAAPESASAAEYEEQLKLLEEQHENERQELQESLLAAEEQIQELQQQVQQETQPQPKQQTQRQPQQQQGSMGVQIEIEQVEQLYGELEELRVAKESLEKMHDDDRSLIDRLSGEAFELRMENEALNAELGVRSVATSELHDALSKLELEQRIYDLEAENNQLREQQKDPMMIGNISSEDLIKAKEDEIENLQLQVKHLEEELQEADETTTICEDVVHQWEARVNELNGVIKNLEDQLQEQEKEANDVISQWQESYNALEQNNAQLARELEESINKNKNIQDDDAAQPKEEVEKLRLELKTIQQEKESLVSQVEQYKTQEAAAQEKDQHPDSKTGNLWERIVELNATINDLKEQLQDQEKEANDVIAQWQESCASLEAKNTELIQKVEGLTSEKNEQEARSDKESTELKEALNKELQTLREERDAITNELQTTKTEKELEVQGRAADRDSFNAKAVEFEAKVKDLEEQLVEQEAEANDVISQWQDSCNALEEKNSQLARDMESVTREKQKLSQEKDRINNEIIPSLRSDVANKEAEVTEQANRYKDELRSLQEQRDSLKVQFDQLELKDSSFDEKATELEAKVKDLEEQLVEQEMEAHDVITQWQESCNALEGKNSELSRLLEDTARAKNEMSLENNRMNNEVIPSLRSDIASKEAEFSEKVVSHKEELSSLQKERDSLKVKLDQLELQDKGFDETAAELEAKVKSLEHQLEEQEMEANDVIAQWQESCSALEGKNTQFSRDLENITREKEEVTQENQRINDEVIPSLRSTIATKEAEIREQVSKHEKELTAVREQLNSRQLGQSQAEIQELNENEKRLKEKVSELESTVEELKEHLELQEFEANEAIAAWQESYSVLQARNEELDKELNVVEEEVSVKKDLISSLQSESDERKGQTEQFAAEIQSLKEERGTLTNQLKENEKEIERAQFRNEQLHESLKSLNIESSKAVEQRVTVEELKKKVNEQEVIIHELEERRTSLESENTKLSQTIDKEIEEKNSLSEELHKSESALQEEKNKLGTLEDRFERVVKEREADAVALKDAQEAIKSKDETIESLTTNVHSLTSNMEEMHMRGANKDHLQSQLEEEKATHSVTQAELDSLRKLHEETKVESEDIVNQWKESFKELEATVEDLEDQLEQQATEANDAISRWELRNSELEEEVKSCKAQIESERTSISELRQMVDHEFEKKQKLLSTYKGSAYSGTELMDDRDDWLGNATTPSNLAELQTLLDERNGMIASLIEDLNKEKSSLEENQIELNASLNSQKETVDQLRSELLKIQESQKTGETPLKERILELEEQVEEKEESRKLLEGALTRALASEREICRELESDKEQLQGRLERLIVQEESLRKQAKAELESLTLANKKERQALRDHLEKERIARANAEEKMASLEAELASRAELAKTERSKMEEAFNAKKLLLREHYEDLEQQRDTLRNEKAAVEHELEKLRGFNGELEDELREVNNELQLYVTDEVSVKAAEMAAQALRDQVDEMRLQLDENNKTLASEREKRMAAEQEVERLKANVVALMGMKEQDVDPNDIDNIILKAFDKVRKKELSEIEELQKTLSRLHNELLSSRAAQRDAEDRASKSSLHASACQQELVTSKSDLKYLMQTMEEMREGEETRRASYEHRIRSLENDHEVLRKFHSAEMENLRNELTQVSMEKDRIQQALKDSEKKAQALLTATGKDHLVNSNESAAVELMRLRVEKAQLLVAAAEEGSRTERRIREAIAAQSSSSEAETIVERELRIAAETALKHMKLELDELRTEGRATLDPQDSGANASELEKELAQLKKQLQKQVEEKNSLREKFERDSTDWKIKMDQIQEECRTAQARVHRLEREGRFVAEVKSEVGRLRTPSRNGGEADINIEEDKKEEVLPAAEVYDLIQNQRDAIEEEREMYHALLEEHDDLLALLAQHDLIRVSLHAALVHSAGQDAVDIAMREAEEKAIAQYGKFVRVV